MEAQPESDPKSGQQIEEIDEEDEDDDDEFDLGESESESTSPEARMRAERENVEAFFRRLQKEQIPVRVHDIIISGKPKTKEYLIEAVVGESVRSARTFQQLVRAVNDANLRLQELDIFDAANITLEAGPQELPGTVNLVIEVSEPNTFSGDFGIYTKPEARSSSLEASLRLKNLFGYGDQWNASAAGYGWGQMLELSTGVYLPRYKAFTNPLSARISLLSQDWLSLSSYKEQAFGLSLGLLSTANHDLSYNLSWRTLMDPSQMASHAVRRQLGHSLLSGFKYNFKIDKRDSPMRPTHGYAFSSTIQIGGIFPDIRSLRFIRQEFDLRYALPLGFSRSALNFGISAGVLFPWGSGSLKTPSYLPERFFIGGNSSPVCCLRGPTSVLGFKSRGLGPAEPRRPLRDDSVDGNSDNSGIDHVGGDLALTAFADLSFDLPLKVLRDADIHGHMFACTGSLTKLTGNAYREFSLQNFRDSFRSSIGFGVVVPTKIFRMEVNYCHILRKLEHDRGKTGIQFSFSSPL